MWVVVVDDFFVWCDVCVVDEYVDVVECVVCGCDGGLIIGFVCYVGFYEVCGCVEFVCEVCVCFVIDVQQYGFVVLCDDYVCYCGVEVGIGIGNQKNVIFDIYLQFVFRVEWFFWFLFCVI